MVQSSESLEFIVYALINNERIPMVNKMAYDSSLSADSEITHSFSSSRIQIYKKEMETPVSQREYK